VKSTPIRAVLDTNVLVSALLFENGRLSWLRSSWQSSQVIPLLVQPTALELLRVLAYPKFKLLPQERDQLLGDLLPWCETWRGPIMSSNHTVRDGHDQVFLDLALTAQADALVSGDGDLLALKEQVPALMILTPAEFQAWLSRRAPPARPSDRRRR
jgi:putative PIN family toxin of toxin-antitoxin system